MALAIMSNSLNYVVVSIFVAISPSEVYADGTRDLALLTVVSPVPRSRCVKSMCC